MPDSAPPHAPPGDFVTLLQQRAQHAGHALAYGFIDRLSGAVDPVDNATLFQQAASLAAYLQARGWQGERVLLVLRSNRLFVTAFLACLMAGVVAVPAPCPRRELLNQRLKALAQDCAPKAVLADTDEVSGSQALQALACLDLRRWDDFAGGEWQPPALGADCLAFLQYTSGSTTAPRGVMVSHGNLWANSAAIQRSLDWSPQSVQLAALPLFHDMGLIVGVLQPLFTGCPGYLMPPQLFAASPLLWLQTMSRLGVTISGGPDFMFRHAAEAVSPAEIDGLDLSRWRVAYSGAEPVRPATLRRFAEKLAPTGFRASALMPCYGMAEFTLMATAHRVDTEPAVRRWQQAGQAARSVVSCGRPADGHRVAIVAPHTGEPCAEAAEGEIWLAGASVTQGYWNKPALSAGTYGARIAGSPDDGPSFLRTGDLGFLLDGELFVTGRLKDLIIVRGRNFAPQDLEQVAEAAHPGLRPSASAAFMVRSADDTQRVIMALEVQRTVVRQPQSWEAIRQAVRRAVLANFELNLDEVLLLRPASIPKTSSGKLQRAACAAAWNARSLAILTEDPQVADLGWMRAELGRIVKRAPQDIDPRASFLDQGIDSLAAVVFASRLSTHLRREVDPPVLFDCGSLERVHQWLQGESPVRAPLALA